MHRGYIKLWRKSLDSQVWADLNLWRTWCCCLLLANHKEDWVKIDGIATPIKVERGQFITGRYAFHRAMYPRSKKSNPDPKTVERWLHVLKSCGNLSIKTSNKYSLITIVNWDEYQGNDDKNVQQNVPQMSSTCPAGVQQMPTNKNVKNGKNVKNLLSDFSPSFQEAFKNYQDMRIKIKKPMTDRAIEMALNELKKLSPSEAGQIAILNQSIFHSWQGLFPLKGQQGQSRSDQMPLAADVNDQ